MNIMIMVLFNNVKLERSSFLVFHGNTLSRRLYKIDPTPTCEILSLVLAICSHDVLQSLQCILRGISNQDLYDKIAIFDINTMSSAPKHSSYLGISVVCSVDV